MKTQSTSKKSMHYREGIGYSLLFSPVYLVGTAGLIKIYSTDDAKDATAVYGAITGFLDGAGISTEKQQAG